MNDFVSPQDNPGSPNPVLAQQIRVKFRTEYEFAVERNLIDDSTPTTRPELREALLTLSQPEKSALQSRLRSRLQRLDELIAGEQKTFDAPKHDPENLVDGVQLSNEMIE